MQTTGAQASRRSTQVVAFLLYLIGGLLIFLLGANTFDLFPTNRNALYEWGLTMVLLLLAVIMQRAAPLRMYARIAGVLFIAAA